MQTWLRNSSFLKKEFKLLQLLSTDEKAFATARRLGIMSAQQQPQQAQTAKSGASRTGPSPRSSDAASDENAKPNARKRRSAARSARRHAQLQLQVYRTALAVLFVCRLRRMRRLRADLADLESLESEAVNDDSGAAQVPAPSYTLASLKRADRPSSSASSASSSYASSSASAPVAFYQGGCPLMLMQLAGQEQRSGSRPRLKRPAPPYAGRM